MRRSGNAAIIVVLLLLLIGAAGFLIWSRMTVAQVPPPRPVTVPAAPASLPKASAGTATLKGRVIFKGEIPERKKLPVSKDPEICACGGRDFKLDESLVVDPETKGVANAVVWVKGAGPGPSIGPATVDQKDCVFSPHVALLTSGQALKVLNPESICHNYHWNATANEPGNFSFPKHKRSLETPPFPKPEFIRAACDIHPWMTGWIAVTETGFAAVTNEKGEFSIPGLPTRAWTVCVWHETLKGAEVKTVAETGEVSLEIPLTP